MDVPIKEILRKVRQWTAYADVPVRVDTSGLASLPNEGDYICVTGASSLYKPGADRLPLVLPRAYSDIWVSGN
ncbi:MAG: hypothetical protein Q7T82_13215 [Armatimonadota bacterium]|nr:hypothetical protein [Armatimonadota bacterium]